MSKFHNAMLLEEEGVKIEIETSNSNNDVSVKCVVSAKTEESAFTTQIIPCIFVR